jgi:hypothetical protein
MNWQSLGGALIKAGAPIIGNALGGPLGGMIGDAIGGVLANALGTEATPDAVNDALKTAPAGELQAKLSAADAEAAAKWPALAEIAKAEADAAARALDAVNQTMRVEAAATDAVQRWWRPVYALELSVECVAVWTIAIADILWGGGKVAAFVLGAQSLLMTYWGARFGVLGVYVGGRTVEKVWGATDAAPKLAPSVVEQIVKMVRRR